MNLVVLYGYQGADADTEQVARLQFLTQVDATCLAGALREEDVSSAWDICSSAAEPTLADAYRFAGGPIPDRSWCLVVVLRVFLVVRLGGPRVPKVRGNAIDPPDEGDVHMYRESSVAPLLDLRRRLKVVVDVIGDMIRGGLTLARSLELSAQWDCILRTGHFCG